MTSKGQLTKISKKIASGFLKSKHKANMSSEKINESLDKSIDISILRSSKKSEQIKENVNLDLTKEFEIIDI